MIEGFKKNPLKYSKKLSEKIEAKLAETKEARANQSKKKWHETSIENFHRSLDHRSFYFKQYEKKLTYHKSKRGLGDIVVLIVSNRFLN